MVTANRNGTYLLMELTDMHSSQKRCYVFDPEKREVSSSYTLRIGFCNYSCFSRDAQAMVSYPMGSCNYDGINYIVGTHDSYRSRDGEGDLEVKSRLFYGSDETWLCAEVNKSLLKSD